MASEIPTSSTPLQTSSSQPALLDAADSVVSGKIDHLERISRVIVLIFFVIAVVAIFIAPLLALAWQQHPFPGFFVDQTLMINRNTSDSWGPEKLGIARFDRVTRIAGQRVENAQGFDNVLASLQAGDQIQVLTDSPDGKETLYKAIEMIPFPAADMIRMFWMPYVIGIAYLAIALWIYRLRGNTRPGRALTFFCIVIAIVNILFFDVSTTHVFILIWYIAFANIGAALISLAWRFPEEWFPVRFHPSVLAIPYYVSIGLSVWAMLTIYDTSHPWAYVPMAEAGNRYAGFGSIFFVAVILYRAFTGVNATVRRQARLMVIGSIVAFAPVTIWFVAPLFGIDIPFDTALYLPSLIIFPISVALAILRYRLWEIDDFVNYAFVYGASTAILAGVFAAMTGFLQRLFVATTGEKSDAATIITTLIIAAAFTPLKDRVQKFVDRHLSESSESSAKMRAFGNEIKAFLQMQDATLLAKRLLSEAAEALGAQAGVLSLIVDGRLQPLYTVGTWREHVALSVPLEWDGTRYGLLQLGPCRENRAYSEAEAQSLQEAAEQVALSLSLFWPRYSARLVQHLESSEAARSDKPSVNSSEQMPVGREGAIL
jgi:hypothetical protein